MTSPADSSRLARALALALAFRGSGRDDVDAFLAEHEDLKELLLPMVVRNLEASAAADLEDPDPEVGTRWIAGYQLLRELGHGGMGTVWLARQGGTGREVALKILSPVLVAGERTLARFRREAQLLATLAHPNLVQVLDAGVTDGMAWFTMDLVRGAAWSEALAAVAAGGLAGASGQALRVAVQSRAEAVGTGLPTWNLPNQWTAAVLRLLLDVAEGLAAVHAAGIVHRDLKASNVLLRADGRALLADFGVARRDGDEALTATGEHPGTPGLLAPELLRGATANPRSDVFAFGLLAHEALTLQPAFAATVAGQVTAILRNAPIRPRHHHPDLGDDVLAVLGKALHHDPRLRYADGTELAHELRRLVAGEPVLARLPGPWELALALLRREPWRVAAVAGAVLAAVLLLGLDQTHKRLLAAETTRQAHALAELRRLTWKSRIEQAGVMAQRFVPARIEDVPSMRRWLVDRGESLAAELPELEVLLLQVRAEALPYGEVEAQADRERHVEHGALQRLDAELHQLESWAAAADPRADAARLAHLHRERAPMAARVGARTTWRLGDLRRQFLHDELTHLVQRLRTFLEGPQGAVSSVRTQLERAQRSHRLCIEEATAAWRRVAEEVRADPRFAGLVLSPQRDLLPLGKDPASGLQEFVHVPSGAPGHEVPRRRPDGSLQPEGRSGIVFVLLPGGTFWRGQQSQDPRGRNYVAEAGAWDGPVRQIRLAPFFLSKYELTVAQYWRMRNVPLAAAAVPAEGSLIPGSQLSHNRALEVLAGHGLTLPTEAQWEYGCRAGTEGAQWFGMRAQAPRCENFADARRNAVRTGEPAEDLDDGHEGMAPIGSFLPNPFGLHDTLGNLQEHVADRAAPYGRDVAPGNGAAFANHDATLCKVRGASYLLPLRSMQAGARGRSHPVDHEAKDFGARPARRIEP